MRNRFTALTLAGLLALGVAACDTEGAGTDIEAPADGGAVDPAAPADPGLEEDPALEPTD